MKLRNHSEQRHSSVATEPLTAEPSESRQQWHNVETHLFWLRNSQIAVSFAAFMESLAKLPRETRRKLLRRYRRPTL